jgi:hypothetical protein
MSIKINGEFFDLLEDKKTVKALATVNGEGEPYVIITDFLYPFGDDKIVYLELLETSVASNNLVRAIWFDKKVSVNVKSADERSFQIKGKVERSIVAGKLFQKYYEEVRTKFGDVDLSAVWVIEPEETENVTFSHRKQLQETEHPFFMHLDRIAR